ncbi:MAG: DUF2723 domain-containing protein [Prevotellaceae bacterium]|jgi:hypothetical protein|nr:DUF2723 domain-containing protein [Prevotellaceae bacterium]
MKIFKLCNNIVGWAVFAIAAITYLLTIEPTGSFWDCGEFVSSAYKLEVGHPPGAPFFMMTARIFSLFAADSAMVAMMVNAMSALCSAFTILFLFWSISHLARKIIVRSGEKISVGNTIAILGAATVGALAYTFSDTFWFSAVEGEVYAYSSLFTAVAFWCILKWEDAENDNMATRWLILTAYLMGLSIGVHLLNLLAIPAIVLVYYFKKTTTITPKGVISTLLIAAAILVVVLYGLIPGFTKVAGVFEILCVNTLGLPFNTGLLLYLAITIAAIVWAILETHRGENVLRIKLSFLTSTVLLGIPFLGSSPWLGIVLTIALAIVLFAVKKWNYKWLNLIVVTMAVISIGYSTYAMLMIRSAANTPMDQNSPEDVFSLQSYLNREQYGDRPLFYGKMYPAPEVLEVQGNHCVPIEKISRSWTRKVKTSTTEKDSYMPTKKVTGYKMDSRFQMLFPRMYSSSHVEAYKTWANIKGTRIKIDRCGRPETRVMPTFGENLRFFFSYQLNFMYWRYFMWNFAGRQNDIQGHGELDNGNWISGISSYDNARLGDQSLLPEALKNNKGRNVYYMLPLLLGIFGILWQLSNKKRGKQNFWIVFTLFFMTGIAIVIYLNQTPYQPRERDYAYAGSFYAFCIWIGLGVIGVAQALNKILPKSVSACVASLLCLGVPALMAQQNWDDHDRSNRYTARDVGANYLNSCAQNAILFCNGDNDTFPLWYNQEVEGTRTDIRSCNLSYLQTDWYIDQMKRGAYESQPLPISWEPKDYAAGKFEMNQVIDHPQFGGRIPLSTALDLMKRDEFIEDGIGTVFAPEVTVPIDRQQVLASGTVAEKDAARIVPEIRIKLGKSLNKASLMVLELINSNNWERPIYFCVTVGNEFYPALQPYLQLEGLAYRLTPVENNGRENTDAMYDNMMNKFKYGNIKDPNVYLDANNLRMCNTLRMLFARLADALIQEGKPQKALEVLARCQQELPEESIPYDFTMSLLASCYYQLGDTEQADAIMKVLADDCMACINYVLSLPVNQQNNVSKEMQLRDNLGKLQNIAMTSMEHNSPLAKEFSQLFESRYQQLAPRLQ